MATTVSLRVRGLGRQKFAALSSKAKRLGMTPERYLIHLPEEDLALDRKARTTTLAELLGPGREVDEAELDGLVEEARTRHFEASSKRR
jgi:hypothetical protein